MPQWRRDYHLDVQRQYYSVPYQHVGHTVEVLQPPRRVRARTPGSRRPGYGSSKTYCVRRHSEHLARG